MSDRILHCEAEANQALRHGLHSLPVPRLSAGFDENVLAGLHAPLPWWRRLTIPTLWRELRPVAAGGGCAFLLTIGLYVWSSRLPLEMPAHPAQGGPQSVVLERRLAGLDLDNADLHLFSSGRVNLPPRNRRPVAPVPHHSVERSSVPDPAVLMSRSS